jgi:hypothetical protein
MKQTASSYDWSMWDRESIIEMVQEARELVVYQNLTVNQFHEILTKHIKKYMPIRSRKSRESQVEKTRVWIGGAYYQEWDKDRQKSIELALAYHPKDRVLEMPTRHFNRVCNRVADVLLHEIIHMRQARKRKFKEIPGYHSKAESTKMRQQQEYFGDPDEVDAYAFNMACELNDKFDGSMRDIVQYLNKEQRRYQKNWDTWGSYQKAFNFDTDHRIIRKLKKRCIYYLSRSQISKPFQSKDWIHR